MTGDIFTGYESIYLLPEKVSIQRFGRWTIAWIVCSLLLFCVIYHLKGGEDKKVDRIELKKKLVQTEKHIKSKEDFESIYLLLDSMPLSPERFSLYGSSLRELLSFKYGENYLSLLKKDLEIKKKNGLEGIDPLLLSYNYPYMPSLDGTEKDSYLQHRKVIFDDIYIVNRVSKSNN